MKIKPVLIFSAVFLAVAVFGISRAEASGMNPCNPCAKKEMKNPCNPCNPCSASDNTPTRSTHIKDHKKLVKMGEKLWNNTELGTSGLACMSCHEDHESLNLDKNKTWPHYVAMPDDIVTLDQMVNFCMVNPMEGKQLDPNSVEMTAIGAFYTEYAKKYIPGKGGEMNPCNPCNPCARKKMKNPCNPCGR